MFEKGDSSTKQYERFFLSVDFTAKFELVFVLTQQTALSHE